MRFESLIGTFLHPQDALLTISFCLSGNRASRDRESCTHEIGSHKSPNSDEMFTHVFLASIGNFPHREIGTYKVVIHCPRESPIPDPRCHLALTPTRVDLLTTVLHYVVHRILNSPIPDSAGSPATCPCQMDGIDPVEKSRIAIPTCTNLLSPETPILRLATLLDLLPRVPTNGWFRIPIGISRIAIP
jgi:hypothetical protein